MVARLRIHIHGAKGLPAADSNGLSDAFLTGELEGKPKTKFKTEIVPGTLNPTWDQDFVINGFERGDMLSLKVFDYDNMVKAYTVGNDFLGAFLMLGEDFYPYGFDGQVELTETGKPGPPPSLRLRIEVDEEASGGDPGSRQREARSACHNMVDQLASSWSQHRPTLPLCGRATGCDGSSPSPSPGSPAVLRVQVHSASGLRAADSNGTSDPFVVGKVRGKDGTEFRTTTVSRSLSPQWHEEFEILEFVPGDALDFVVYDEDNFVKRALQGNDDLGHASLKTSDFWPHGCSREVVLEGAGRGQHAILRLSIIVDRGLQSPYTAFHTSGQGSSNRQRDRSATVRTTSPQSDWPSPHQRSPPRRHGTLPPGSLDAARGAAAAEISPSSAGGTVPLKVIVIGAAGLRAADWRGLSDPYVAGGVVGKPENRFRTKTVWNTLDPSWGERFDIRDFVPGDRLEFKVYDEDNAVKAATVGDDFLGEAVLHSDDFYPHGFDDEVTLDDASSPGGRATLRLRISVGAGDGDGGDGSDVGSGPTPPSRAEQRRAVVPQGPARLGKRTRAWPTDVRKIRVTILSARDLAGGAPARPYCTCEVPGRPRTRFATESCPGLAEPRWGSTFDLDYMPADPLRFSLFDEAGGSGGDVPLGEALLPGRQFFPHGLDAELQLEGRASGRGRAGRLHVRVDVSDTIVRSAPSVPASSSAHARRSALAEGPAWVGGVGVPLRCASSGLASLAAAPSPHPGAWAPQPLAHQGGAPLGAWPGQRTTLLVTVREMRCLRAGSLDGRSHIRCTCECPGRPGSGFQTGAATTVAGRASWNHEQGISYVVGDGLQFEVADAVGAGGQSRAMVGLSQLRVVGAERSGILGTCALGAERFYPQGLDAELTVAGDGIGIVGMLSVRIAQVGASASGAQQVASAVWPEQRALQLSDPVPAPWRDGLAAEPHFSPAPRVHQQPPATPVLPLSQPLVHQSPLLQEALRRHGSASHEVLPACRADAAAGHPLGASWRGAAHPPNWGLEARALPVRAAGAALCAGSAGALPLSGAGPLGLLRESASRTRHAVGALGPSGSAGAAALRGGLSTASVTW